MDTAGVRNSDDAVEKIGIERARRAIEQADHVLQLVDASETVTADIGPNVSNTTLVYNKIDLLSAVLPQEGLKISATKGIGITELREHIKNLAGYSQENETVFTARRRHVTALTSAGDAVARGVQQLKRNNAGELLADELLQAQSFLSEITGEFSADDLLGEIFAGFCIGK